jgi:peroxiredoxin
MSLTQELQETYINFKETGPQTAFNTLGSGVQELKKAFDPSKTIQVGQGFPSFELQDATGKLVSKDTLLRDGVLLISFYRGEWCPYCNLELRALQKHLPEFKAKGVSLVAISPQLPDNSISTVEKHELQFTVLSDVDNKLARKLGIVWSQPDTFRPLFQGFGVKWQELYGNENLEIPIPATFLVDKNGVVRNMFLDPDYTKRLDPETALEWATKL